MALLDDTRADWDARNALRGGFPFVAPSQRKGRMWHWDGDTALGLHAKPHSACLVRVRADQAFHQNTRGWRDIGYPVLICPHGRAIEGAGIDKVAAHCAGFNTSHIGAQLMVGRGDPITPAMLTRARQFATDTDARCGHRLGDLGHRDGFSTSCPGDEIYAWVRADGPHGISGPAGSVGSAGSTPVGGSATGTTQQEDDMAWTDMFGRGEDRRSAGQILVDTNARAKRIEVTLKALEGQVNPAAFAAAIAPLISTSGQPVNPQMLEDALRKVLGSVDEVQQ